jgi:microtubule-associated protein-like 6
MGQTLGRAPLPGSCKRFLNLPKSCINDLWEAFNDIAEGFGLTIEEFQEIVKSALMEYLGVTEKILNLDTDTVFRMFDDDENHLVDSLEFLSSFALLSGMTPEDKIRFVFAMYDFDETSLLTLDETVLAFRSCLSGLSKLSKVDPPTEAEIESIVLQGFNSFGVDSKGVKEQGTTDFAGVDKETFLNYCINTPEILSWIEYFDDLEEYEMEMNQKKPTPQPRLNHLKRTGEDEAVMNPTLGGKSRLDNERLGPAVEFVNRQKWENVVPFLTPSKSVNMMKELPSQNFTLDWAYGYNAHSGKNNTCYSAKGRIIFPTGAVCVVQDVAMHEQKFFTAHSDVVLCMKCYHTADGSTIVASGEAGVRPSIHIWNAETLTLMSTLKGFHRNGVAQVDFSPDHTKLATIGLDTYHSIAVYLWVTGERIWASRTTSDPVHDIRFLTDNQLASCGKDHIYFWKDNDRGGYHRYRGMFGSAMKPETLWCVAMVEDYVVTGSDTGMVHVWEGRNVVRSIKGHTGTINACYVVRATKENEVGFITACSGGKLQLWNSKLELGATFNALILGSLETSIISVCWDMIASRILIGFKSCEIFEMDATDGRNAHEASVVSGHSKPNVSGLSVHPLKPHQFCTVGSDKFVRIYDTSERKVIRSAMLDTIGHCCTYSPNGQMILVGLGTGIDGLEERKEGAYVVLSEADLTLLHEARDSKYMIADCKYSPDGSLMALACNDGSIYVYNAHDYAARARCRGHAGKVEHLDFSHNNQFIMSNSSAGELLFWDSDTAELQAPKVMKDMLWDTNSCVFSHATQGCWGPFDDKAVLTAVCRSNGKDLVATSNNYGDIRVYNSPCVQTEANYILLKSHGANAQNCRFVCDDSLLITTGGTDGAVFQWKVTVPELQNMIALKVDDNVEKAVPTELKFDRKSLIRNEKCEDVMNDRLTAVCEMEEGLVDVGNLMPWQRTIVAPSSVPVEDTSEPPDALELEFVYSFTADRSRKSLMYDRSGDMAFFSAAVAVLMNQKSRSQRFYTDHNSTITAMATHPEEKIIATGEQGEMPQIRVWNSETFETISVLVGYHRRAVTHVCFSGNGELLGSVGQDTYHSIAVYHWKSRQIVSHTRGISVNSFAFEFIPGDEGFLQCGNECIRFWDMDGLNMRYQDALLGSRAKRQGFLSIGWIGNHAVIGTVDGNLYKFYGKQLDQIVAAHSESVNTISSCNYGLCTGSSDRFVKIWSMALECRLVIDMKSLGAVSTNVRVINWDPQMNRVLVGTASSEIFELNTGDGENLHPAALLHAHAGEQLWGLSVNPTKNEFCTVGDDASLMIWETVTHQVQRNIRLELPGRCCAYSPDGKLLAIGYGTPQRTSARQYDGKWVVMTTDDYVITHEARDSLKWLTEMKFSPNGEILAIGSFDNKIYIYGVNDGYNLLATVSKHQNFIRALDFSKESDWLMSNCAGMELMFFEADSGIFIPAASRLRDVQWETQNCAMAWAVQGIWPPQKDATECTAAECNLFRIGEGPVVVSGDNYGRIQLYRYPCTNSFACSKKYHVSSNEVTRLRFAVGDSQLLSVIAKDKALMQWKHTRDRGEDVAFNLLTRSNMIVEEEDDVVKFFGLDAPEDEPTTIQDLRNLMGGRPWVAALVIPSNPKPEDKSKPSIAIEKAHVFGNQVEQARSSVHYNSNGDILYPTSKYVCVYSKKRNTQIYYEGHTEEVSVVAVSDDKRIAASAESSKRPEIHVWDACTCQQLLVLPTLHRSGVASIRFSADRLKLVSVGKDNDHSLAVWETPSGDWTDGKILASTKGDVHPVLFCCFYDDCPNSEYILATGGRFHVKFWKRDGRCLNSDYAEYSVRQKLGTILCGVAVGHNVITGSTSGHVFVWLGRTLKRVIRAHDLAVVSLWACKAGILSSSKDGSVKQWSNQMEHLRSFSLFDSDIPPILPSIRSIDGGVSKAGDEITRILVTTAGAEIYEIAAGSGSTCLISESHYTGELWGLCVHPTDPDLFMTAGDDKTIRVWSIKHKRVLRKAVLDCTARCVSWSPDGHNIVVGMGGLPNGKRQRKDGAFLILEASTLKPLFEGRDSRHWLQDAKFSPDGKSFAIGSMDHKIYIYNRETFRLKGACERHSSFIRGFDFSEDSVYIQSDSGDYEHLYFEAEDGEFFAAGSQLRDIQWYDMTCSFGYPVQGAWPEYEEVEKGNAFEPSTVHRSRDETFLSVGDTSGAVKIYHYPCVSKDAMNVRKDCHVNDVAKVRFSCDSKHLITIGKQDRTIVIWNIMPEKDDLHMKLQGAIGSATGIAGSINFNEASKETKKASKKSKA